MEKHLGFIVPFAAEGREEPAGAWLTINCSRLGSLQREEVGS